MTTINDDLETLGQTIHHDIRRAQRDFAAMAGRIDGLKAELHEANERELRWTTRYMEASDARIDDAVTATNRIASLNAVNGGLAVELDRLVAAVQTWHDTRYNHVGDPGNRPVNNPVDLALLNAAGVRHRLPEPWEATHESIAASRVRFLPPVQTVPEIVVANPVRVDATPEQGA
jgi:hypothetical protein